MGEDVALPLGAGADRWIRLNAQMDSGLEAAGSFASRSRMIKLKCTHRLQFPLPPVMPLALGPVFV